MSDSLGPHAPPACGLAAMPGDKIPRERLEAMATKAEREAHEAHALTILREDCPKGSTIYVLRVDGKRLLRFFIAHVNRKGISRRDYGKATGAGLVEITGPVSTARIGGLRDNKRGLSSPGHGACPVQHSVQSLSMRLYGEASALRAEDMH